LNYPIPFSLRDPETVWFLLVAGPVLEELIFRGALWKLFEVVTGSALPAYLFTAVLFSYSEFHLIHQVKPEYADFVRYQASFCLGLGLFCGGMRMKYGWRAALITHAIFNFGFWLGSF
jgi:membrane protease YdiL (CAAX protease family)